MQQVICSENIKLINIDINSISMSEVQPRKIYDNEDLESLSNSIMQNGLLEPIRVVKKGEGYELLYGHRRLLAAKKAGIASIAAIVQPDPEDKLQLAIIENTQRQDLTPLDEAEAYQVLCSTRKYSLRELSQIVNKSRSLLSETLKMNAIPEDVKCSCRQRGHLAFRFLKQLSMYGDEEGIRQAYDYYLQFGKFPPRRTRHYGSNDKRTDLLEKLTILISKFNELDLDADKDREFLRQIRERVEVLSGMLG